MLYFTFEIFSFLFLSDSISYDRHWKNTKTNKEDLLCNVYVAN